MRRKRSGLTMIEILIVVGIIAILVGLFAVAGTAVQKKARGVKQKAQFTAIDLGLAAFRSDYGDYPPSDWFSGGTNVEDYCGAGKLAEALLGWDLMGFHPNSAWHADGTDAAGGAGTYDPARTLTSVAFEDSLKKRRDRYIDVDAANVFRLGVSAPALSDGLFLDTGVVLKRNIYVLCDVFQVPERKLQLSDGRAVTPGTPILYFRANVASKTLTAIDWANRIYNLRDNRRLIDLGPLADWNRGTARRVHPIGAPDPLDPTQSYFYRFICDPKMTVPNVPWPYRPDSYILISAGPDGLYGTEDDICNFGQR